MAVKLRDLGCYEISLGDTIGVGTPGKGIVYVDTYHMQHVTCLKSLHVQRRSDHVTCLKVFMYREVRHEDLN